MELLGKSRKLLECVGTHILHIYNKCKFNGVWFFDEVNVLKVTFHHCNCYGIYKSFWTKVVCFFNSNL